ncbi:CCR4-Not complex component, Not1 family protein [Brugia malayi]|uniref:CCR4-Not complex component, Not1 family protein n=3 Tax=Brugia TaxID=6278 RepID=A0A4E9F2K2_BRUMA|nr:CCR4-Not complex component, Not1 family protein [Brugia malayi]VIO90991.1 CCR4-Not complex component, Not1 family protein [Brugia malayi]
MSISVTPTSIALASIDRLLVIAAEKFDSSNPTSLLDEGFLNRIFVASSTESGIADQYVFRVLLDNIITSDTFLSDCLPASSSNTPVRSASASTGTFQKQTSASRQQSGSLSARKYDLQLKSDFCVYVIRQQLKNCVEDPTAISIRLFYRFVEVLEERLVEIRYSLLGRFLETLLVSLLSVDLFIQVLVGLTLFSSSLVPQIVKGLGQYLRTTFTTLFEAIRKDNSTIFDCALSIEFIHQLFTSLLSTQVIEFAAIDQQSVIYFLKIFEKELNLRGITLIRTLSPLQLILTSVPEDTIKVPLSSTGSDHLSPFDYVDLEDRNLDEIMDSLAYQNPNLLAQQIQEIGTTFTSSVKSCRQHLISLNSGDGTNLNAVNLSRVIVMMINTCSGSNMQQSVQSSVLWDHRSGSVPAIGTSSSAESLSTTTSGLSENSASAVITSASHSMQQIAWNAKNFANAVRELAPNLNWSEIVMHLDQTNFIVRTKAQLQLLTTILLEGLGSNPFPIGLLYREWNFHKYGQLSWIEQILQNPDVFCFSDYPHKTVNLTPLKVQPQETRELSSWRCLDLVDTLIRLGEVRKLVNSVMNILHKPTSACPDVLLLALLQMQLPTSNLRIHLMQMLIPTLIGNHPNAVPVLNVVWNCDDKVQLRPTILTALCSYYMKNPDDQAKLSRILEVAHELKPDGLAELFNVPQFPFTIDLACLASRRDFLKLDKWIDDKLAVYGDAFASQVICYIRRRLPAGMVNSSVLPQETMRMLLNALSRTTCMSSASINDLSSLCCQIPGLKNGEGRLSAISTSRTQLNAAGATHSSTSNMFNSGIGTPSVPVQQPSSSFGNFPFGTTGFGASNRDMLAAAQQMQNRQQQQGNLPGSVQIFGTNAGTNLCVPGSNTGPFPQANELLKATNATNVLQSNFNGSHALSMSPSGQMMRTSFMSSGVSTTQSRPGPGAGGSGWSMPVGIPGTGGVRTTSGSSSGPSSTLDFRMPPGAPGSAGGVLNGSSSFVHNAAGQQQQQQPSGGSPGRITVPPAPMDDLTSVQFSEEIQNEANMYFQQIYSQHMQMPVADFVERLKQFKASNVQRDKDILACVVKNLFEEYRFFHEYPERELRTTAEVYGSIIREGVISNLQFATAVRKVIESLQAEPGSMLWTFGIVALNACRTKLSLYPKVCVMIANQRNFQHFPQNLKDYVTSGIQGQQPHVPGRETPSWQPQQRTTTDMNRALAARSGSSVLSVTSVDTLVNATEKEGSQIKQPPETVMEKVAFLFNNLSQINLPKKVEEIKIMIEELDDDFIRWLAQYLVMKRVSIEQNFQPLYNLFLLAIENRKLEEFVKLETFRNIKILLRSDKRQAATNFGDRQLLKNLGLWLGAITIARDHPVVTSDLDMKSLLMEAYYKGQQELLFVVPFIAKILVSCSKSQIFGPNCAWIKAIFKILAELHNQPDLKLNLKFEIEVLCKELGVDLSKLTIEDVLKDTERLIRLPQQLGDLKMLKPPELQMAASPIPTIRANSETSAEIVVAGISQTATTDVDHLIGSLSSITMPRSQSPSGAQVQTPAHFHYHDINIVSFDGLTPHLKLSASLPLFQLNPQLKHVVRPAISHAIKELIGPVTERAIRIAMHVTEHICKKDFALEPDEQKIRRASQHMIRAMTAGMASITCREPLSSTILGFLKTAFTNSLRCSITPEQQKLIDEAATTIAEDNVELATNFIVKTACEKATPEMDKRLESEFATRKQYRLEGRQYADPVALARAQQMPEKIRLRVGSMTNQQMVVYDEFSSRICGFKPTTAEDMIVDFSVMKSSTPTAMQPVVQQPGMDKEVEQFVTALQLLVHDIDSILSAYGIPNYRASAAVANIRDAISQLASNPREPIQMHNCIQRIVEQVLCAYRNADFQQHQLSPPEIDWNRRLKDVFLQLCRILLTQIPLGDLARRVTRVIVDCRLDYRFNVDAMDLLAKHMLIQMNVYDQNLAMLIDSGSNFEALIFAQRFLKLLTMNNPTHSRQAVSESMPLTMEQLAKAQQFGQNRPTPESFATATVPLNNEVALIGSRSVASLPPPSTIADRVHNSLPAALVASVPLSGPVGGSTHLRGDNMEDGAELQSKVEMILREWIQLCYTPQAQKEPQQALAQIVHVMHEQGVISTDEMITRFFRLCTEMCVDVSYRLIKNDVSSHPTTVVRQRCYYTLDAFVKLTCLMIKHSDGSQYQTKINLLKKVLNIITNVLHLDHEVRGTDFHSMPYQRILIIMFNELTAPDPTLDVISWHILEAFGQALFILQPRRVPGFAYAWLDIIGHRNFIGRLLKESTEPMKTAAMYTQLIICHLKFLAPFLRNIQLPKSIAMMYKGTLRVLLVILHDFPELLCEYHIVICDTIPPNCVQLRNLVLSAYPKNMRLPDPFGSNLKVDSLLEMTQEPKMNINMAAIIPPDLRTQLDDYLNTRSSVDFHANLPSLLQVSNIAGSKYNTTVMNAVVIYVGMRAIQAIHEKQQCITMTTIAHTAYMDIFQNLAVSLCTEGRYLLFNAIANQLRYPNSHTHYFSCTLLYLFLEANTEVIQEQITRILFERLVALRPHPWGLLITFIELIKNPSYSFWKHEFVRCAPEIERLFQSVANSCMGSNARHINANAPHTSQLPAGSSPQTIQQ